jgi:hypothetical protein
MLSLQISRVARFLLIQSTKTGKYTTNCHLIFQTTEKHTDILHSEALQNLPKLGFLVENEPSGNPC